MSRYCLNLQSVKVSRGGCDILSIDNLSVDKGSFVNVAGPNGSGKTTLLKVICGLIKPSSGKVFIDGVAMSQLSVWGRVAMRKKIGYIPQFAEYNAELPFTVREVVMMGAAAAKPLIARFTSSDYENANLWLERVGLGGRGTQTFRTLSGGEQQKVLIARAMVQNPEILLLDEPTASLDFQWKSVVGKLVREFNKAYNVGVVMVSHELAFLPPADERVVLLKEGRIVKDDACEQVLASPEFAGAYGQNTRVVEVDGVRCIARMDSEVPL